MSPVLPVRHGDVPRPARDAGAKVTWLHAGMLDADLPAAGFDLVSAQYPALRSTPDAAAERALLAAVARLLDEDWTVEVHERRTRHVATGAGAHHTADLVLRARRLR